jgi:SAM-dependent methyltransferase/uncharacterized protein YbaR (Trm112 family)
MSDSTGNLDPRRLRALERQWQDEIGHALLDKPFEVRGSALVYERQFERIAAALEGLPNGPLVEIGCGRGQFLEYLGTTGLVGKRLLVGIDPSIAVSALPARGAAGIRGDGEQLPLLSECAAAVVYNGALHHVVDYRAAVREALRVLMPGGKLVIFEPVSSAFSRAVHRALDPIIFRTSCEYESPVDQHLKHAFREEIVLEELTANGASVRRDTSDFLAYPFTGCYAGSVFTKSQRVMRGLIALERFIEQKPLLRAAARAFAWRFLLAAEKPGQSRKPAKTELEELLACPKCRGHLAGRTTPRSLRCDTCRLEFSFDGPVPILLVDLD